ncbi:MAG: cytochrome c3 family protein, partial [Geobacteraceae bacterium]|nr:cytochrome c3 family protein [Geobacteraceae bacterium]
IITSPHNLSATGTANTFFYPEETRICIFCHAPHSSKPLDPLWTRDLWNRDLPSDEGYFPYASSTLTASVSPVPTGGSRLCLSCHDGTIALTAYGGSPITTTQNLPSGRSSNLTKNLADDHPISFVYDASLAAQKNGDLAMPYSLPPSTKLDNNGELQCTSCHDPHNNEFGKFLVKSNNAAGSPLCSDCHTYAGWAQDSAAHYAVSRHKSEIDPTSPMVFGCMVCHDSHTAPKTARLLHKVNEEDNCLLSCHNASLGDPKKDISSIFQKTFRHPVEFSNSVHDESETPLATTYHVECADCHNPHKAKSSPAPHAAIADGPLNGARGYDCTAATQEFGICFRCHSGSNAYKFSGVTNTKVNRAIIDPDQQRRFESINPSIHPVTIDRSTTKGAASLITVMTRIYCTDCHGNDQSVNVDGSGDLGSGVGAVGPHGSSHEHILVARYDTPLTPPGGYSFLYYALCYRCHQESFIMGGSSGFVMNNGDNEHSRHVRDRGTPCFVCHDPHGVPANPSTGGGGGTVENNAHLINFNKDYAGTTPLYVTSPIPGAYGSGDCTVNCHTNPSKKHSYPTGGP